MNPDGTSITPISNSPGSDIEPTWLPDGKKLVFTSKRDGDFEIYIMNADGSDQTRLTNLPEDDHYPAWSPDGRLGVAANAGCAWSIPAIILFLIMAVLTFVQRAVTGM